MRKTLLFSIVSLMLMLCGTAMAENKTVTFEGSDFTETTSADYQTTKDGVTVAVKASTVNADQLRIFKNQSITISSADGNITKIEFTCTADGAAKYGPGSFGELEGYTYEGKVGTWKGNAANVTFTATNNQVRATKIVVTIGEGGDDDPEVPEKPTVETTGKGTLESPYTAADATAVATALGAGNTSAESYYISGKVSEIKYEFDAEHGTATFYISADGTTEGQFNVYGAYYLENKAWQEGNAQIKVGDDVIVFGKLTNYKGTPETASKQNYIYSLNGNTKNEVQKEEPQPQDPTEAISVAKALEIINALADGKTTTEEYLVQGYVVEVTEISTQYGNATFTIADEKGGDATLTVFRVKGFGGESIADENIVKQDDLVVVKGKLQKYVKNDVVTPELATGGQIVTVNGKNGSSEPVEPKVEDINVAKALEIINALEDGKTTAEEYEVTGYVISIDEISTNYGNATFTLADDKDAQTGVKVFRAKGFDNEKIADENIVKVGNIVKVHGKLQRYVKDEVMTPEVSSCYIVSVEEGVASVESIGLAKQQGQLYNLSGQRVRVATKGLYIRDGKKFLVK